MQGPPRAISRNCSMGSKVTRPSAHDLLEEKAFGEGAAEVLPHVARDPLALLERHAGKGEGQIVKRPLLAAEAGSDEAPSHARFARGGLERTRGDPRLDQPESGIFQPIAQFCREAHHSASQSARGPKAPDCAEVAALSRRAAKRRGGERGLPSPAPFLHNGALERKASWS